MAVALTACGGSTALELERRDASGEAGARTADEVLAEYWAEVDRLNWCAAVDDCAVLPHDFVGSCTNGWVNVQADLTRLMQLVDEYVAMTGPAPDCIPICDSAILGCVEGRCELRVRDGAELGGDEERLVCR
jgi:hypothetical protein